MLYNKNGKCSWERRNVSTFETVSLSHQTVSIRVDEISDYLSGILLNVMQKCNYYSLALDESNDISDNSKFIIFIRTIEPPQDVQLIMINWLPSNNSNYNIYFF